MPKYVKKAIAIEAFRLDPGGLFPDWFDEDVFLQPNGEIHALIPTLEGVMRASQGDYIIKGIKGEIYPCKPDIFEATYDQAG